MNTARTSDSFERALTSLPSIILGSTYTPNLRRYFNLFPREQVKVVIFEEFVSNQQQEIDNVTDFLGVPSMQVDSSKSWYNRTSYTMSGLAQRQLNRVGRYIVANRYRLHMDNGTRLTWSNRARNKLHHWFFRHVNPVLLRRPRPPPMKPETRAYLTKHLTRRNHGLSELLDRDMEAVWKGMQV